MRVSMLVVALAATLLAGCEDKTKFRPWTDAERGDALSKCVRLAQGNHQAGSCMAKAYCSCATRNYEGREMPIAEFHEKASAIVAYVDGRSGYFCTDTAKSQCGSEP